MHARHVTIRVKPERLDEAVAIFEGSALPCLRAQAGFVGAWMLMEPESGRGAITIVWKRRFNSLRLEESGFYRQQIAKFAEVFAEPPQAMLLEVRVSTFAPQAPRPRRRPARRGDAQVAP